MGEELRRERPEPRALAPWLVVAAIVYFGGQLLPLPGIDHEAFAQLAAQGGMLGLFDGATPGLALIGITASSLVVVQLVLLIGGALDRPMARRIGFLIYVVFCVIQGLAIAFWAESAGESSWFDLVYDPGWAFRINATLGITAGGAMLWWVFSRIDRSGRAHGALFLCLLAGVQGAIGEGFAAGTRAGLGATPPFMALTELALPVALCVVAIALLRRPARWPVKLFGPVSLRSSWDALALPALVALPFGAITGGVTAAAGGESGGSLAAVRALLTLAVGVAFAVYWMRRDRDPKATRALGAALVASLALVTAFGAAFLGFSSSGGIEAALDPGPLAGDASYSIVLEADYAFADGDADAMVQRLESLGAHATLESHDEERIALRIEGTGDLSLVLEALQPHVLEMSFTREYDEDLFAGTFGITPVRTNDGTNRIRGWGGDCDDILPYLMEPPSECEPVLERSRDSEYGNECTLHCLEAEVILSGADIADARVSSDPQSFAPVVTLELTPEGATHFGDATGSHLRRVLAIIVDGEVVSAPVVQSRIDGGRVQITLGMQDDYEAMIESAGRLAAALRPGARISGRFRLAEQSL